MPLQPPQTIAYPAATIARAERAIRCSPFRLLLLTQMGIRSVALSAITGKPGVQQQYTRYQLPELLAENDLLWLIQVGVLRREVDGQGLTDSFRLTPLGRQLVEIWQNQGKSEIDPPQWSDRLLNTFNRWLRLPL